MNDAANGLWSNVPRRTRWAIIGASTLFGTFFEVILFWLPASHDRYADGSPVFRWGLMIVSFLVCALALSILPRRSLRTSEAILLLTTSGSFATMFVQMMFTQR